VSISIFYINFIYNATFVYWSLAFYRDEKDKGDANSIKHYLSIVSRYKTLVFVSRGTIYSLITGYSASAYITRRNLLAGENKAISLIYPQPFRSLLRSSFSLGGAEIPSSDSCVSPILPADLTMSWRSSHGVRGTPRWKCKYIRDCHAHDYCRAAHNRLFVIIMLQLEGCRDPGRSTGAIVRTIKDRAAVYARSELHLKCKVPIPSFDPLDTGLGKLAKVTVTFFHIFF